MHEPPPELMPVPPGNLAHGEVRLRFDQIVPGNPLRGFVPSYHFRILDQRLEDVDHINLRIGDTEHVRYSAGHIGYHVHEACRGHGYARQACLALAPFARVTRPELIITCDPDNLPSIRTIERLGACLIDVVDVPPHDPQYEQGSRQKRRYLWTP